MCLFRLAACRAGASCQLALPAIAKTLAACAALVSRPEEISFRSVFARQRTNGFDTLNRERGRLGIDDAATAADGRQQM